MALITAKRLRNTVLLLSIVSTLSSCVRHETVCECWSWNVYKPVRMKTLLAKRIKTEYAEAQCRDIASRNPRFDTCKVSTIK